MFTGLIEGIGALAGREPRGGDARLRIDAGTLPWVGQGAADITLGESIAVNGACLTVAAFDATGFEADASNETLALTSLGELAIGRPLNLERAMRPSDRLGGHLVSGHVDGVGKVLHHWDDGRAQRWLFEAPASLRRYIAAKGSICVDGVSLTVNAIDNHPDGRCGFEVALVPHTLQHTAFAHTAVGDPVNLEIDLVARYVERLLAAKEQGA